MVCHLHYRSHYSNGYRKFDRSDIIRVCVLEIYSNVYVSTDLLSINCRRFVAGLGVGALSAIVPLYNGEAAPKKIRGAMLVLYQLQIIIG